MFYYSFYYWKLLQIAWYTAIYVHQISKNCLPSYIMNVFKSTRTRVCTPMHTYIIMCVCVCIVGCVRVCMSIKIPYTPPPPPPRQYKKSPWLPTLAVLCHPRHQPRDSSSMLSSPHGWPITTCKDSNIPRKTPIYFSSQDVLPSLMSLRHASSRFDDELWWGERHFWPLAMHANIISTMMRQLVLYDIYHHKVIAIFVEVEGIIWDPPLWNHKQNLSLLFDFY